MFLRLEVSKIGRTYDIGEAESLPPASLEYLLQYGVDQSGTDCHASIGKPGTGKANAFKGTEAEFVAAVDAKVREWITKIQTGQLRGRVVEDPKVVMRRELAKQLGVPEITEEVFAAMLAAGAKKSRAA